MVSVHDKEKGHKSPVFMESEDDLSFIERQQRHWGKIWRQITSRNGVTICFGVGTFLVLAFMLSMGYLAVEKTVDERGVSKRNFKAPYDFEVVDKAETDKLVYAAQFKVESSPVYLPAAEFNQQVAGNINTLFDELNLLRKNEQKLNPQALKAAFDKITLLAENPDAGIIYDRVIKTPMSDDAFVNLREALNHTVFDNLLKQGVTREQYFEQRHTIIEAAMPREMSGSSAKVVQALAWSVIVPNRRVDEKSMERLKKEAADKVQPVVVRFVKGQNIVTEGELVTPVMEAALEKIGHTVKGTNWVACIGVVLVTAFITMALWMVLYHYEQKRYFSPSYGALMMVMVLAFTSLFMLLIRLVSQDQSLGLSLYVFPLATFALTMAIFTHPRMGMIFTALMVFMWGICLKTDFMTLSVLLFGSMTGLYVMNRKLNFTDRSQLMWAGLYIAFINVVMITGVHLILNGATIKENWGLLLSDLGYGVAGGLLSSFLSLGVMPFLESAFRLVSPYTLMELSNHDKPLLKRMQYESPGTFHHSLMVASLSEAAAEAIGANALLTRVGSLYHDIGKMKRPLFFIENQAYFGAENPHDNLTPRLSKMVITAHTKDSIDMGREHGLPECLLDFMTEHHGTMLAGYFYNKACLQEGAENVNKSQFRYAGPKPRSKETAIVMMADACESAVRALKNPTLAHIEERIDKIVEARIEDGQFDNCPITFRDITIIKETFVRVLRGIQHNRIEYQQSVMKELGKKLPEPKLPNLSELQKAGEGATAAGNNASGTPGKLKVVGGPSEPAVSRPEPKAPEPPKPGDETAGY